MEAACMLMDLLYIIIIYCKQFHTCSFKTWNYVFSSLKQVIFHIMRAMQYLKIAINLSQNKGIMASSPNFFSLVL